MKIIVNYANPRYEQAQKFNTQSAVEAGKADCVLEYGPESIDTIFFEKNRKVLQHEKGGGYWLWKPYIILDALRKSQPGDILMYVDSGCHFIKGMDYLTDLLETSGQDIIPFEVQHQESAWSKRDAFSLMGLDGLGFESTRQRLSGFIVVKNSQFSLNFFEEFLSYAQDIRIIGDYPNVCGFQNFPDFQCNRHDQTVFSLLSKKYKLEAFRDPSQWGNREVGIYPNSPYPQIIELTRNTHPKKARYLNRKFKDFKNFLGNL